MSPDDSYAEDVEAYFRAKAADYDRADLQPYWRLSDSVLWALIERDVLAHQPRNLTVLDAGAGTGRWALQVLDARADARAILLDRSEAMLAQAEMKLGARGLSDRATVLVRDLDDPAALSEIGPVDLVLSFHNVLGFLTDPEVVVGRLAQLLRPGGQLVLVVPSVYHMAYFALKRGRPEDALATIDERRGRFTDEMPAIHTFSPASLAALAQRVGLVDPKVRGFPCLLYPGEAETQVIGSTGEIADLLDEQTLGRLVALEIRTALEPDTAGRGNNLYLCATRP